MLYTIFAIFLGNQLQILKKSWYSKILIEVYLLIIQNLNLLNEVKVFL